MSTPTCRKEGSSIPVTPILLVRSGPQKHSAAKRGSYNRSPPPAGCTHSSHGLSTHFCPSLSRLNTQSSQAGPKHRGSAALPPRQKQHFSRIPSSCRVSPHSPLIQEQLPREGLVVLGWTIHLTWPLHSVPPGAPRDSTAVHRTEARVLHSSPDLLPKFTVRARTPPPPGTTTSHARTPASSPGVPLSCLRESP